MITIIITMYIISKAHLILPVSRGRCDRRCVGRLGPCTRFGPENRAYDAKLFKERQLNVHAQQL